MFFNKAFMTNFVTTIGYTVYFPSKEYIYNHNYSLVTLAHEYRHAMDANKITRVLFALLYLMPQILAVPSIIATLVLIFHFILGLTWSWWMLSIILPILFLLPLPAYFRMKYEFYGYSMSLFTLNELYKEQNLSIQNRKDLLNDFVEKYNKHFTGSNYYYMWPFGVKDKLQKVVNRILSEEIISEDKIYQEIINALKESNN